MPLFKNIVVYRIGKGWRPPELDVLDSELKRLTFQPCSATQQQSTGWIPPRQEFGAMVESISGQWILRHAIERKAVPVQPVLAELAKRCEAIENDRGRKPGKMERRELKDEITLEFLPRVFAKKASQNVWLDIKNRILVVEATSYKQGEAVVRSLVDVMAELHCPLAIAPLATAHSPNVEMGNWLRRKDVPSVFSVDRDLELKQVGDKQKVRYANHDLGLAEVREHIESGKLPTYLAMTFNNRVSFVLSETLALKRIDFIDVEMTPKGEDGFDTDVAIETAELTSLIPQLIEAIGGELELK